jgi:hypothetical protein
MEQMGELLKAIPKLNVLQKFNENCEYVNAV